ncbi:hypothetical protein [Methylobacterium pseudosasicola]|uniref:hypothetical protein n=1 Tax=Methylobacterium pseudosasicola TaxID=582667 RepID=UPI0011143422|nr:hypothetical protein [Methylobacterium pseudosasicola]
MLNLAGLADARGDSVVQCRRQVHARRHLCAWLLSRNVIIQFFDTHHRSFVINIHLINNDFAVVLQTDIFKNLNALRVCNNIKQSLNRYEIDVAGINADPPYGPAKRNLGSGISLKSALKLQIKTKINAAMTG